jgi:hypothetical protein
MLLAKRWLVNEEFVHSPLKRGFEDCPQKPRYEGVEKIRV